MNTLRHKSLLNTILYYSISIGTLLIIVSSGVSTMLRFFGIILITFAAIINIFKSDLKISLYIIIASITFFVCFTLGLLRTTVKGDEISEIYSLTILLAFLLPYFIIIYSSFGSYYLEGVIEFLSKALVIIFFMLFFSLIFFRLTFGDNILHFLSEFSGGFYYRPLVILEFYQISEYYPLVWFQASIMAMPLAIYNLFKKNINLFFLLSMVVFLSLNRTGSFLVIFIFFISLCKNQKKLAKYFLYFILILPLVFLATCFIINALYTKNVLEVESGFSIRVGHVISVMEYMVKMDNFFWGMGADSLFITIGRDGDGIVRNQEISYLEVFRRFGIIGYFLFNLGLSLSLIYYYNLSRWWSFYSLFAYIIFSFTNPCLISIIFIIYYAIISSADLKKQYFSNHCHIQS